MRVELDACGSGVLLDLLGAARPGNRRADLRAFLPYAMGSAPWFRVKDKNDPLFVPMADLSARDVLEMADTLKTIPGEPALFPGKFAQPVSLEDLKAGAG